MVKVRTKMWVIMTILKENVPDKHTNSYFIIINRFNHLKLLMPVACSVSCYNGVTHRQNICFSYQLCYSQMEYNCLILFLLLMDKISVFPISQVTHRQKT